MVPASISTLFRIHPLTPLKTHFAIQVARILGEIELVIRFRPADRVVSSHQLSVVFCSRKGPTQSTNVQSVIHVTNELHIEATDRISDITTPLPSNFPPSNPAADVRVATDLHTIKHGGTSPITKECTKAHHIQRIRIEPPVLRYIPMKNSFPHHDLTRRRRLASPLMRRTRCYSIPAVRRGTEDKINDKK